MLYHDSIYGPAEISEPVLADLLHSAAMQRLKGVLQHGVTALIGVTAATTRFDHSVGAMLLARRLGAPLKEQIAALLHDVSHTAFSHVIDFVFDSHENQSYHEEKKQDYVAASDLPAKLAHHGYDWRDFMDDDAFPLLEQPSPALCADRLDYFLRGCIPLGLATPQGVKTALDKLVVDDGRIAVSDLAVARWLAYTYIASDRTSWANLREVGLYELTARAIKAALRLGIMSEADVWRTDDALWEKLHQTDDHGLQTLLRQISADTRCIRDECAPTFRVRTKLRTIDPPVLANGEVLPLSAIDDSFARYREQYLEGSHDLLPIKIIPLNGE